MTFQIKDKTLDELQTDLKLYPLMRMKLQSAAMPKEERERKLERVFEEELMDNLALLYYGYSCDCLDDFLGCRDPLKPLVSRLRVNFGSKENQRHSMYCLCQMLSQLNLNVISRSTRLVELYDSITNYIEAKRRNGNGIVLYDYDFWCLYFDFYNEYQCEK